MRGGPDDVRQQRVRGGLRAVRATGSAERVDQGGLSGRSVQVVDAGYALALVPGDLRRFGAAQLDPHDGDPRGRDAVDQARLEGRGGFSLFGGHAGGVGTLDDEPLELREL